MRDEYAYHSPTAEQLAVMNDLREQFSALQDKLDTLPPSRYRSLAGTTLETAAFWTNKAIVLGEKGNR